MDKPSNPFIAKLPNSQNKTTENHEHCPTCDACWQRPHAWRECEKRHLTEHGVLHPIHPVHYDKFVNAYWDQFAQPIYAPFVGHA